MQNPLDNNSDSALLAMAEYTWMTYLGTNRICPAIKAALLQNKYILQAFGNEASIISERRDDFTIISLPALTIYEPEANSPSRFYAEKGIIHFDMFLPVRLDREDITAVFSTLGHAFKNIIQSIPFWSALTDAMIPLPVAESPIYNDVLKYKNKYGSPLVEFGKEVNITFPTKYSLKDIDDAWKLQLKTSYLYDMSNHYAMLETFGIQGQIDPNKIVYEILQSFQPIMFPKE